MKAWKKLVCVCAAVCMLLSFAACAHVQEEPEDGIKVYDNIADYSNVQGYQGWYYFNGDYENQEMDLCTYDPYYARWHGSNNSMYYYI